MFFLRSSWLCLNPPSLKPAAAFWVFFARGFSRKCLHWRGNFWKKFLWDLQAKITSEHRKTQNKALRRGPRTTKDPFFLFSAADWTPICWAKAVPEDLGDEIFSVANPAEPRGENIFYFFLQILGGEKLLKFGEKCRWKIFSRPERGNNYSVAFRIVFRVLFRVFQTVFRVKLKLFQGQFRSAGVPP